MIGEPLALAVDAGNTKTEATVVDLGTGSTRATATAGTGDIYAEPGPDRAVQVVTGVADQALEMASATRGRVVHAAFRLAGIDWPEDEQLWRAAIDGWWPGLSYSLKNDGYIFTHLADPSGHGVSVVLGTGGAIAGVGPSGEFAVSWWLQHSMGASGLVHEATRAAALAELGLGPSTLLRQYLPRSAGVDSVADLLHAFTARDTEWTHARIASLAPTVERLLYQDHVTTDILTAMTGHVADYIGVVAARCGLSPGYGVAVGGGMVTASAPFASLLADTITARHPETRLTITRSGALGGVVLSAIAEAGLQPTTHSPPAQQG